MQRYFSSFVALVMAGVLIVTTGCASIFNGGHRQVMIDSNPQGAGFTITNPDTQEIVTTGTTPQEVTLDPYGGYLRGQPYVVTLDLPNYPQGRQRIEPSISGWFFGNILIGGLIGMLAVDANTGDMWNLTPDNVKYDFITRPQATTTTSPQPE